MAKIETIITDHLDVWSSAIKQRNSQGRGSSKKQELYGIQKLRELILELAVRGLLVPQDPSDEPASVLLERIKTLKHQMVIEKKIKKPKKLSPISEEEKIFNLPNGWVWVKLQDISEYIQRGKGPKYDDFGEVKVISQKCIQWSGFNIEPARFVNNESLNTYQHERFLQTGDLLWNSTGTGTVGRVNVLPKVTPKSLVADSHVTVIRTVLVNNAYIKSFISSPSVQNRIEPSHENALVSGSTKQVELNTSTVVELTLPLPPLAEQKRIVEKVDELMALCDQLEEQQENSIAAHQLLVEVLLAALTQATDAETFEQAWAHLAANFDTLFTTENSIEQLKQTLLQLAVMGKLVPQDPNDEPASVLLDKIAAEKEKLIKEGKIKKQKPLLKIENNETLLPLPNGSEWVRLGDLSLNSEAGWSPRCEGHPRTKSNWGVLKVSAVTWGEFNPNENKELPANLEPREKYEVLPRDFLISRANTAELVARAVVVPEIAPKKLMMSDKIIRFRFSKEVDVTFIKLVNDSQKARDYYAVVAGGTSSSMKNVSREQIRNLQFVLPPLAEQKRIVEKVDQLFAICDQLKEKIRTAEETQLQLADALTSQAIK